MSSRIFDTILQRKIDNFVATFVDDSKSIFYNESQLLHPGEFGKYRENSIKELLSIITKYKISDGFIITSKDSVSTQCDIVIYDSSDLPILENNFTQFFTIENTIAIGEVKSTISYTKFKKSLIKLAKNKRLHNEVKSLTKRKEYGNEHDTPISFLVCKNLTFKIENIDFEDIYKGIDRQFWHDNILVVEQGLFAYEFEFKNLVEPYKSTFIDNNFDVNSKANFERSSVTISKTQYDCNHIFIDIDLSKKYYHIMLFLTSLSQAILYKTLYETHFIQYSSLNIAKITKE